MNNKKHPIKITLLVLMFFSLIAHGQNAVFTDHGFIPTSIISVGGGINASEFQTAIHHNGFVFIATSDGVWKNDISTQQWATSGLQGKGISCIYKDPIVANKIFAGAHLNGENTTPLFISNDSGVTWDPITSSINETISCIATNPTNKDHVYANVSGPDIISSLDGGINWSAPGGYFGYSSNIIFTPLNGSTIYQGSEQPLDCAWLAKYDIDQSNIINLLDFQVIVDGNCGSGPWENRRPNKLQTYDYTGNTIYVGQEGALSKVDPTQLNQSTFIYKSEGEPNKPYSYIYAIWVDPTNTNHLIFGGSKNGGNTGLMQIYETWDEGATFYLYTQLFNIIEPEVCDIVAIGNGKVAVIINDKNNDRVKLIVMEQDQSLHVEESNIKVEKISIYPNPINNILNINYHNNLFENVKFEIFDMAGKLMKTENSTPDYINLDFLESGMYQLVIQQDGQVTSKKFVVQ